MARDVFIGGGVEFFRNSERRYFKGVVPPNERLFKGVGPLKKNIKRLNTYFCNTQCETHFGRLLLLFFHLNF
jgi:hypothetical protein